jgi:hypothetical protein
LGYDFSVHQPCLCLYTEDWQNAHDNRQSTRSNNFFSFIIENRNYPPLKSVGSKLRGRYGWKQATSCTSRIETFRLAITTDAAAIQRNPMMNMFHEIAIAGEDKKSMGFAKRDVFKCMQAAPSRLQARPLRMRPAADPAVNIRGDGII